MGMRIEYLNHPPNSACVRSPMNTFEFILELYLTNMEAGGLAELQNRDLPRQVK